MLALPAVKDLLHSAPSPFHYYYGISLDPPELLYRSDIQTNPFPVPQGRFAHLPPKTVHGVLGTRLNAVWDLVAPQIRDLLKSHNIHYSAITTARFSTRDEDGNDKLGPIVIWVATHPSTTTTEDAHNVSPAIISLLEANGVEGAITEWYEGTVKKLSGPPLQPVDPKADATYYHRRLITAALGMPITTREMAANDTQGSVAFFFHENKYKNGDISNRVLAVSNCHVLRNSTNIDYEHKGAGSSPPIVQLAGHRRFQRAIDELKASIDHLEASVIHLTSDIAKMEQELEAMPPSKVNNAQMTLKNNKAELTKVKNDISVLEAFDKELNSQWGDIERRNIGHVDWAPKISVGANNDGYILDIGTFELNEARFKPNFAGNIVDLGTKFTVGELIDKFYARNKTRTTFKYPYQGLLRINGCVTRELLANPDCLDSNNQPCLIVMKDGNTTDLTVGRYSGTEAYLCDERGVESIELAIYNYDKDSGSFSAKGDSGSLIFDGLGKMVGILHSGMPKGTSNHVTFATPAWYAIEQLKVKYPYADLNR
ncbi:hypothetical protein BDP27DRAFT_1380708 [Rhodocollybia butyracea]|uniref:Uncharacterized protein n=1 Tax=Rhodocollybia butyracea TaxID=206335 RepID=A0A9P5PZV6_9AGAR|nr:hypothetical protein BDP27DRAFT_1380708 [Rhodocollybia butyracea]